MEEAEYQVPEWLARGGAGPSKTERETLQNDERFSQLMEDENA